MKRTRERDPGSPLSLQKTRIEPIYAVRGVPVATNLYKHYQESAITQSDPIRLVEMMFEGAIRFTRQAIKAIDDKDLESAHNHILRTYAIVAELMATLDFEQGGEIAVQLEQCYDYILHLLKEANIKKEKQQLIQVVELMVPLLSAWQEAFKKNSTSSPKPPESDVPQQDEVDESATGKSEKVDDDGNHKTLDLVG